MIGSWYVWSDFGGVLTPPVADSLARYCTHIGVRSADLGAAALAVARRLGTEDVMEPLDRPLLTEADWARRVAAVLAERLGRAIDLGDVGQMWFDGRAVNGAWLSELRRLRTDGVRVGLLSNMPPAWDARWRRMVDPAEFDALVLSFEVGSRKPDAEIFALAAAKAGVPTERCVLVDDTEVNCAGARAAGWQAVRFTSSDSATAELAALLAQASEFVPTAPALPGADHPKEK